MTKGSASRNDDAAVDALAALPSLGKASARMLVEAGIADVAALRRLGTMACYRSLRFRHGRRVTVNFAYALECAILGIDWRDLPAGRKVELKRLARAVQTELARPRQPRPVR